MPLDQLAFMKDPSRWPNWPRLPLKRKTDGGHGCDFATVMLFDPRDNSDYRIALGSSPQWTPTTPEQLFADGWKVD